MSILLYWLRTPPKKKKKNIRNFLRKLGENLIQKACVENHRRSFYNLLIEPEQRQKLVGYY
jgi:hypothetical protein